MEDLEEEREREKEAFGAELKNFLERMKKEREMWEKEKKTWREKREMEKEEAEAEAARKAAEAENDQEQKRCVEEARQEGRKTVEKLEKEVLNGRKLIGDLQADKRRDRQLLLELRAKLAQSSHAAPPSQMNSFRFGGSASQFMGPPAIAGPSALAYTGRPAFPISDLPSQGFAPPAAETPLTSATPIVRLPSSGFAPSAETPQTFPQPIVRLPSRPPHTLSHCLRPLHYHRRTRPKGRKAGAQAPSRGPEGSQ